MSPFWCLLSCTCCTLLVISAAVERNESTWPNQNLAVRVDGDIIIGGLLRVHESSEEHMCGQLLTQSGMQSVEVMLYTLDQINNGSLLPGFTLGLLAFDDCNQDAYSLEQSVKFVRLDQRRVDYDADPSKVESACHANGSAVEHFRWTDRGSRVTGVVGASSSSCSMQVANLLKLFKIPQVAYWATINDLSNKDRFPYLFRTVPPDRHQAMAMLDILQHFNWTFVSIVHDTSNYALRAVEELTRLVKTRRICLATTQVFPHDATERRSALYDDIVSALLLKHDAKVVIVWSVEKHVSRLLQAVQRKNKVGHFIWIGSDSWSGRQYQTLNNEAVLEGAITIHPTTKPIKGFDEYFPNLSPLTNRRNPWFLEYWEVLHNCTWATEDTIASHNRVVHRPPHRPRFPRRCSGQERFNASAGYHQLYQLQFVADALLAFAYALRDMHAERCRGVPGLCAAMRPVDGKDLREYLKRVHFKGITGAHLSFDESGDGPARYTLLNYQQVSPGEYKYVTVGHYSNKLHLNGSGLRFKLSEPEYPASQCGVPCLPGEKKVILNDNCCWRCEPCGDFSKYYLVDEETCGKCERGSRTNASHNGCVLIPAKPIQPDGWVVFVIVFAALGIFTTGVIGLVFIRYRRTPLVKASGKELMTVLLIGVFLCYSISILFFVYPTSIICGLHQLVMSHGFTVCYSAILVKTNRVHRIFQNGRSTPKRPDFISPMSQVIITVIIIGVQAILSAVLMAANPPHVMRSNANDDEVYLVCHWFVDHFSLLTMAYPLLLMLLCTAYAFLTRKIPCQFNEAKFIGFTLYTTCIIWLAMVPIYVLTASNLQLRIISIGFAVCLSASVSLACLFAPKVYTVLFRPNRNVRMNTAMKKVGKCHHSMQSQSACSQVDSSTPDPEREML